MEADKRKITVEMISDLVNKLGSNDGFVREYARVSLIDLGKEAVPSLIQALASRQQQVRW